jgi:DNA-binding PadR family transcriptional regulator
MTIATRSDQQVTPLQCEYLQALSDGRKTGKQMRGRLRRKGVRGSNGVFYRAVQRLKNRGLITTELPRKGSWKYRRQERFYILTAAGRGVVGPKLEVVKSESACLPEDRCRNKIERARACLG